MGGLAEGFLGGLRLRMAMQQQQREEQYRQQQLGLQQQQLKSIDADRRAKMTEMAVNAGADLMKQLQPKVTFDPVSGQPVVQKVPDEIAHQLIDRHNAMIGRLGLGDTIPAFTYDMAGQTVSQGGQQPTGQPQGVSQPGPTQGQPEQLAPGVTRLPAQDLTKDPAIQALIQGLPDEDKARATALVQAGGKRHDVINAVNQIASAAEVRQQSERHFQENKTIEQQRFQQTQALGGARLEIERKKYGFDYDPSVLSASERKMLPIDDNGNPIPLKSPEAPTAMTKNTAQTAKAVDNLLDQTIAKLRDPAMQKKLGPFAGRMNEVMAGTVGAGDPDFSFLRTLGAFDASGMLKVHFGSRGGTTLYENFKNMIDTGRMDSRTMLGALQAMKQVTGVYKNELKTGNNPGTTRPATTSGGDFFSQYGGTKH